MGQAVTPRWCYVAMGGRIFTESSTSRTSAAEVGKMSIERLRVTVEEFVGRVGMSPPPEVMMRRIDEADRLEVTRTMGGVERFIQVSANPNADPPRDWLYFVWANEQEFDINDYGDADFVFGLIVGWIVDWRSWSELGRRPLG
jgi:hypothetical protein